MAFDTTGHPCSLGSFRIITGLPVNDSQVTGYWEVVGPSLWVPPWTLGVWLGLRSPEASGEGPTEASVERVALGPGAGLAGGGGFATTQHEKGRTGPSDKSACAEFLEGPVKLRGACLQDSRQDWLWRASCGRYDWPLAPSHENLFLVRGSWSWLWECTAG